MLNTKQDRRRLAFMVETSHISAIDNIKRQFSEKHAIARTSIHQLIPYVLERNNSLVIRIVTTDSDAISHPKRVKAAIEGVTPQALRKRVQFVSSGWEIHTMGYFVAVRNQRLHDVGEWMCEMREHSKG